MVEITQSTIVTPLDETPKHKIYLSNLDLAPSRKYTPTIYVYPSTGIPDFFPVQALKAGLAKALVVFYPLAGRLSRDPETGRIEIDCTGEGVNFLTADLDATLDDFKDYTPSTEMRKKLVPVIDSAEPPCVIMAVQMTHLRCGGIVLGFAIHHYTIDGRSASLFIKTLSSLTRGDSGTIPAPFFDHSILRSRSPPSVSFDHSDYSPNVYQSKGLSNTSQGICSNFKLTKEQIHSLKIVAGGERVSTFRAVVSLLWKCTCIARGLASDVETQLILPVDLRDRFKPPLPANYFGNPTLRAEAVTKVGDLVSNTLEFGANLIQKTVESITDEFGRSLIDHLESTDLEALCKQRGAMSNTSLMAISWLSFPMYDADFGWGQPMLMARAELYGSGYVYLSRVPTMDGEISVVVGLEPDSMQRFKKILYEEIEALEAY